MSGEIDDYERLRGLGTPELLELAVGDENAPDTGPAIAELHARGEQSAFDAAISLIGHANARHRAAGASILAHPI